MLRLRSTGIIFVVTASVATMMMTSARADGPADQLHADCLKKAASRMAEKNIQVDAALQEKIDGYCDCEAKNVTQQFSGAEFQALMAANPDPALLARVKPITAQCYQENFQQ